MAAGLALIPGAGYLLLWSGRRWLLLLRLPAARAFAWLVILGEILVIALIWLLLRPGGQHLPAIALFRLYLVVLAFGGALLLLYYSNTFDVTLSQRWTQYILLAAVVVAGLLTVLYLGRVPPSKYFDEALLVGWAQSSYAAGVPHISSILIHGKTLPSLGSALLPLMGIWLNFTGLSLEAARLFGLLIAWISAPFIFLTARRLYGNTAALFAFVFAVIVPLEHSYVRPDLLVATTTSIALYCFFRANQHPNEWWLHAIAGFVLAMGYEGHPYAVRFAILFGLVYLVNYIRRIRAQGRWLWDSAFWAFAGGGLAYVAIYVLLHVVIWAGTDVFSAIENLRSYYDVEVRLGGTTRFPARIIAPTRSWFVQYPVLHPAEAALALFGVLAAMRRNRPVDRLLLATFLLSLLLFFLMFAHFNDVYWIHNLPFIAILGGAMMAGLARRLGAAAPVNFATLAGVSALVALLTLNAVVVARQGQNADRLIEIGREVEALLPSDVQRVAGWQIYYFGLANRKFYDTFNFVYEAADNWLARWGVAPPQALILTRGLDDNIANLVSYVESDNFVAVQCFDTGGLFNGVAVLYLMPQYVPEGTMSAGCDQ